MSGTSMDAVDTALVGFDQGGAQLKHYLQYPIPADLLRDLQTSQNCPEQLSAIQLGQLHRRIGLLFADASTQLLTDTGLSRSEICAIGSHGQTLLHSPDTNPAFTLQLGDPSTIAAITGITTVGDFRAMDMAVGGQGAPLAPAFHNYQFRSDALNRILVNIGGISNITILPADQSADVIGFDTGPGNTLMDAWCSQHQGTAYDNDGVWASTGKINDELLSQLLNDAYFQKPYPKSTGRDYFNPAWLEYRAGNLLQSLPAADVQATLLALTVESIAMDIERFAPETDEVLVCGGGASNPQLMRKLGECLPELTVDSSLRLGLDPDCIEAVCFAWLAMRRLENLPGNLPSVTGATQAVCLGGIYRP
jgi:anhydro-N-acetylmuramic acid kinase